MNDTRIAGEELELIEAAFRGMKAERQADGWISVTGRLDPVPGEALMRALQATELELPRRIGSTRDEHRAAALDEIVRQVTLLLGHAPGDASADAPVGQLSLLGHASADASDRSDNEVKEIVRADKGDHDVSADSRVRGRVDTSRHPSGLTLVKSPS